MGKRIAATDEPQPEDWLTIVGVDEDVTQMGITRGRGTAMYTPVLQTARPALLGEMTFAIQTERDPLDVTSAVRAAV